MNSYRRRKSLKIWGVWGRPQLSIWGRRVLWGEYHNKSPLTLLSLSQTSGRGFGIMDCSAANRGQAIGYLIKLRPSVCLFQRVWKLRPYLKENMFFRYLCQLVNAVWRNNGCELNSELLNVKVGGVCGYHRDLKNSDWFIDSRTGWLTGIRNYWWWKQTPKVATLLIKLQSNVTNFHILIQACSVQSTSS